MKSRLAEVQTGFEPLFFHIQADFQWQRPFSEGRDFDRQGVHAGHYFMENYEAAKQDFAVRAGLVERQRLFSDEQLAVIRNACAFALEDDATLSYAEEKQLQSVQEQIELLLPQQTQEQRPTMEQTM